MRPLLVYDAGPGEAEAAARRVGRELPAWPEGAWVYLSGFLIEALDEPAAEAIAERAAGGRLELLGGGLYSPYLPLLPERDAAWQLSDMADLLEERFGVEVQGAFLPDGAFDLTLVPTLAEEGYTYALLPQAALAEPAYAGLEDRGVWLLPYRPEGDGYRVIEGPRRPRAPFPAAYVRGAAHPRLLPRQNPAAADLFAKMRWVSDKLEEAHRPPEAAYQRLYRGQWGPAYRGRDPAAWAYAWRQLLAAENLCDPRKYAWLEIELYDMDADGFAEVVVESHTLNLYLRPAEGGRLFALDVREGERPLLGGRSLGARWQREGGGAFDFGALPFEASKYRDRIHLYAEADGYALKTTLRLRPKAPGLDLEWRLGLGRSRPEAGTFWVEFALAAEAPDAEGEDATLALPELGLTLAAPRPFRYHRRGRALAIGFPAQLAPGAGRRFRLRLSVEDRAPAG